MPTSTLERDSTEYLELLADVFAEIVQRGRENRYVTKPSDSEVTPALMQCLQYVYLHGASSIHRIAEGLSISMPGASQLVDRLAQRGLVRREESERDRRQTTVELTDGGREMVRRARTERGAWFTALCEKLPEERRKVLVEGLEEFIFVALTTEQDVDKACVKCGIDHLAFCVLNRAHVAASGTPIENY
jgi:DNA-binding MarR family transcriptional regulator